MSIISRTKERILEYVKYGEFYKGVFPFIIASAMTRYSSLNTNLRTLFSRKGSLIAQPFCNPGFSAALNSSTNTVSYQQNHSQFFSQNSLKGIPNIKTSIRGNDVDRHRKYLSHVRNIDAGFTRDKNFYQHLVNGTKCKRPPYYVKGYQNSSTKNGNANKEDQLASNIFPLKIGGIQNKAMVSNLFTSHSKLALCILCELSMNAIARPFYFLAAQMATDIDSRLVNSGGGYDRVKSPGISPVPSYSETTLGYLLVSPLDFTAAVAAVFSTSGWVGSNCIVRNFCGNSTLLRGLRISIGARFCSIMFPYSITFLSGVHESLLNHRITAATSVSRIKNSSIKNLGHMVHEGFSGIFRYGILTAMQIIPGFLAYVAFRYTLWVIFGTMIKRKRQKIVRCKVF